MPDPPRVLIVGSASWNTMIHLPAFPEPRPATVWPSRWHEAVGASGAGKALNLARLGVSVTLHALTGDDDAGRRVRAILSSAGIQLLPAVDPTGTSRHVNLMDASGGRISVILHSGDPDPTLDLEVLDAAVAAADVVYLGIVDHARRLIPLARRHGRPIWTDLHGYDGQDPYRADFVAGAEVVLMSNERLPDPRPVMERMREAGKRLVVCTMAERGAVALTGDGRWLESTAEPVAEVVDTNGAGDAFAAGLLVGELRGLPVEAALRLAARVAARAVTSPELAAPDLRLEPLLQGLPGVEPAST